jgi:HTH-type transcriptional repressor of NAD biosynthesis genes
VIRVCILGAESSGKTTLAQDLAARYDTLWVPEYGRIYTEVGRDRDAPWTSEEFDHIARVHLAYEDFLAGCADRVLFCDTDAFTTEVFHEAYLGRPGSPALRALADERRYDLFLLCDPRTPFFQDGGRLEGDEARRFFHESYLARLEAGSTPWLLVQGTREERVAAAAAVIDALVADD